MSHEEMGSLRGELESSGLCTGSNYVSVEPDGSMRIKTYALTFDRMEHLSMLLGTKHIDVELVSSGCPTCSSDTNIVLVVTAWKWP